MIFDPSNALNFGQGFFSPNLVAIWHCQANWPLLDPSWPLHDLWPKQCIMLWSGVLPTKFGGHRPLSSKFTPTWPQLTPVWPLTPAMHYALVRSSFHQICSAALATFNGLVHFYTYRAFLRNLTSDLPQLTPAWPLTPAMSTLWSGDLPTKFGGHRAFLCNLTPGWPLHDLWPRQCIALWSGVLLTKFGGQRALLSKLTPTWPQLTPAWPSTPAMHYALIRGSSHQIWWP